MLLVMLVFQCALHIIIDLIPIFRNRQWKVFWAYSVMMSFAVLLAILISLDIKLPSPAIPLKNAVTSIFGTQ